MNRLRADIAAACAAFASLAFTAQGPALADQAPDWQTSVLSAAADHLEPDYIYEDRARDLAAFLRAEPDRYADIADREAFAAAVSADLYRLTEDAHLRLFYRPEDPDAAEAEAEARRRRSRCAAGGIEHERLTGDVGYIRVTRFHGDEAYVADIDAAFTAQADASALIVDLRSNCGGGPHIVRHISTYLFAAPTHLTSTEMRGEAPRERWTYEDVPGPRFLDRPVIILTNGQTFSAAESFTFGLKVTGRVLTAGERTGGGGHFGGSRRLDSDFVLFVPIGRTYDPATGLGWEAEGIEPDIPAASEDALDAALDYLAGL